MHKSILECVEDLERTGQLLKIQEEVDPYLEMADIHRQVYRERAPAILFENIKGSGFSGCPNIFGTIRKRGGKTKS